MCAGKAITVRDYRKEIPGALKDDRSAWVFPVINSTNKHGKTTNWQIQVRVIRAPAVLAANGGLWPAPAEPEFVPIDDKFFDNNPMKGYFAWIKVDSYITGSTPRKSDPTLVRTGKNIGKESETNVFCQALRDAYGLYNKQLKKARGALPDAGTMRYPPMLSQLYRDQTTPPAFPVFVQRKYDGVRVMTTLERPEATDKTNDGAGTANEDNPGANEDKSYVIMYSRKRNLFPGLEYIKDELLPVLRMYWEDGTHLYLDGEVYLHGKPLQDISGYTRRPARPDDARINYMVYDCFVANKPDLTYAQRKAIVDEVFSLYPELEYTRPVETFMASNADDLKHYYDLFLGEKFEGAMIRVNAPYEPSYNDYHSSRLLKLKPAFDAEYEIVGYTTGRKGKAAKALMFRCKTPEGKVFDVTPAMELPKRIELAEKMGEKDGEGKTLFEREWLGQKLIVTFDEMSRDKVPQRARTEGKIRTWD